jgi:peptide/nickel transport system permease protein
MQAYVIRRLVQAVPVVFLVTLLVFLLLQLLPGDPAVALLPPGDTTSDSAEYQKALNRVRDQYGLNDPLPVQYVRWLGHALRGDLGTSIRSRQPVTELLTSKFPMTAQLALMAWLFAMLIALPAGVISAVRRNSPLDVAATVLAMGGVAMPSFFLGILLILVFTWWVPLLPAPGGAVPLIWENPPRALEALLLPAIALGLGSTASVMRLTRSSLLETLAQDYVRTARAKGLAAHSVVLGHALRNALLPVVTVIGIQWVYLLAGSVIIEQMFAIPGMGRLAVGAIQGRDYVVVQGFVLFIATIAITFNLVIDILYGYLDPRIRYV